MTYHFIGLGGIGMSALARILLQKGYSVQGSDLRSSTLLQELEREGAKVHVGHHVEGMAQAKIVVYSSGIKEDNIELSHAKNSRLPLLHRSDLLDELMRGKKVLFIAGAHGKTTTSALLAQTLLEAGLHPSFVVGGVIRGLNTNGKAGQGEYFVAEADESDGSFLRTPSYGAILTNIDDDHLDYWGTSDALEKGYQQFIKQTEHLFWCSDCPRLKRLHPKGISYGFGEGADFQISNFRQTSRGIVYDLNQYPEIEIPLYGRHNALNSAAVFALALYLQIPEEKIRCAFKKFAGTERRLERKGEKHKVVLFDDYGHHPKEIQVTLSALREKVRERRLVVVFQPHRYTRVRDLFEEFTNCFAGADELIMTDIYSAGEAPIPGVTSASLYTRLREKLGNKVHFFPRTHLESGVAQFLKPLDVVLTLGAGDITHAGEPILNLFQQRAPKWTVGVLFGGASAEHPVSLMSARNIVSGLDPLVYESKLFGISQEGEWRFGFASEEPSHPPAPKISSEIIAELLKCDVCIPVFHGPKGEDGMMAALLEAFGVPYVGCDYRSGALCMQKTWTKEVAAFNQIPIVPFFEIDSSTYQKNPQALLEKIGERLSYPVWIKPVHLGSSIGVSRAETPEEALKSAELAFQYDDRILIEEEIRGRQIEFSLLGNEQVQIALPGEIVNRGEFVAYDKKYGAGAMEIRVPAQITECEKQVGLELAERAYRACGCQGLARIDFFLDEEGYYWLNEINPFPGFTDTSAFPKMWHKSGLSLQELVDEMIAIAFHRSRSKGKL